MELNKLPTIVLMLVLVGLIVGVGVLVFDKFGEATRNQVTVTDENVTITSNAGTLAETPVKELVSFTNSSGSTFTVGTQVNVTLATGVLATVGVDGYYDATYVYYDDSSTTTNLASSTTALGGLASNWMGLIVTIVVLSLILFLVVRSFGIGARK